MSFKIFILFSLLCLTPFTYAYICNSTDSVDQAPVIGVLAQEVWNSGRRPTNSVIVAGYVKFLEGSGAQVVPVLLKQNDIYYSELFKKLNGLLLPGGALLDDSIYMKTAKIFWDKATNNNPSLAYKKKEDRPWFPIWGTCLGFEAMFDFISGEPSRFAQCNNYDTKNNVHLTATNQKLKETTKLFKNSPNIVMNVLRKRNVTVNFHHRCMTLTNMTKYGLNKNIRVLGTNRDKQGLNHVSMFEAKYYPFYGVMFHPEAVLYEFKDFRAHHNIPHDSAAVRVSQYLGNFFVEETRKNTNCFASQDELNQYLIHNYQPVFTGADDDDRYIQKYFFPL